MLTTLAAGIKIQRNASVEPLPPAPTYGSQYPVEESYHTCHQRNQCRRKLLVQFSNWTEDKTRDELQNEQEKTLD
jgi:hypothetical protein